MDCRKDVFVDCRRGVFWDCRRGVFADCLEEIDLDSHDLSSEVDSVIGTYLAVVVSEVGLVCVVGCLPFEEDWWTSSWNV